MHEEAGAVPLNRAVVVPVLATLPNASDAARTAGEQVDGRAEASLAPPKVLIHHLAGSTGGLRAARRIAQEARKAGYVVVGIHSETAVPSVREVRIPAGAGADARAAERLTARLRDRWGNAWRIRVTDGTRSDPEIAVGGSAAADQPLELWLPHR
jgi:hypothetical protein